MKDVRKMDPRGAFVLLLFPLMASLLLSSCGFHLRGAQPVPGVMANTYIQADEGSQLYYELESALYNAGARVVDAAEEASATLSLHGERFERRVLSVDPEGRAAEYELTLRTAFSLTSSEGESLAEREAVTVIRDYSFDPDNVLAKSDEEAALKDEMVRFAVEQMMRRIDSLARQQPAAKE